MMTHGSALLGGTLGMSDDVRQSTYSLVQPVLSFPRKTDPEISLEPIPSGRGISGDLEFLPTRHRQLLPLCPFGDLVREQWWRETDPDKVSACNLLDSRCERHSERNEMFPDGRHSPVISLGVGGLQDISDMLLDCVGGQ